MDLSLWPRPHNPFHIVFSVLVYRLFIFSPCVSPSYRSPCEFFSFSDDYIQKFVHPMGLSQNVLLGLTRLAQLARPFFFSEVYDIFHDAPLFLS